MRTDARLPSIRRLDVRDIGWRLNRSPVQRLHGPDILPASTWLRDNWRYYGIVGSLTETRVPRSTEIETSLWSGARTLWSRAESPSSGVLRRESRVLQRRNGVLYWLCRILRRLSEVLPGLRDRRNIALRGLPHDTRATLWRILLISWILVWPTAHRIRPRIQPGT